MQRALVRAKDLKVITHLVTQFRSNLSSQTNVWATAVTLDNKAKALEIEFNTGELYRFPAELLRAESPAANATHSFSKKPSALPPVVSGRRYINILDVEPVGRYALRIQFDDLHTTGIFSYSFLHSLGLEKYKRMRQYIKALKQQGLSRDPRSLSRVSKPSKDR
ncbi:hypothetical protein NADE_008091 [Nannochloris sp. 'desiccata']|nr:hypothetical protein NADE_008091 [Chlorella desiccata (nom. nud.)]